MIRIDDLRSVIKQHFFFISYIAVCFWLMLGLLMSGSTAGLEVIALHLIALCGVWWLGVHWLLKVSYSTYRCDRKFMSKCFGVVLTFLLVVFSVFHWLSLGCIPIVTAAFADNTAEAVLVRQAVTENVNVQWNYAAALVIGAALPFFTLILFALNDRYCVHFFVVAVFYTASLLQKAPPLLVSLPLIVYLVLGGQYRLAIRWLSAALMAFTLVHFALNGYLRKLDAIIETANASEQIEQQDNLEPEPWTAIQFSSGKGWNDARNNFISGKWHSRSGIIFDGKRALYQPLNSRAIIGMRDFDLNLSIRLRPTTSTQSYGTVLFMGATKGWEGLFQVQVKFLENGSRFLEFDMVDADGKNSFGYSSSALYDDRLNEVKFSRRGQNVFISVGSDVRSFNTRIFNLNPPGSIKSITQLGVQFGGVYRAVGEGHLTDVEIEKFNLDIYENSSLVQRLDMERLLNFTPGGLDDLVVQDSMVGNSAYLLVSGNIGNLLDRLLFVPGRTGAIWVQLIPDHIPYAYGCGYRFIAPFLGCDFINFPVLIHQRVEPELNEQGIHGTMNAAEVFSGYANFGMIGAVITGAVMASFMLFLTWVFRNQMRFGASVSIPFIAMQSSSGLPVALLSGGWLLSIGLFLVFRRYLPPAEQRA